MSSGSCPAKWQDIGAGSVARTDVFEGGFVREQYFRKERRWGTFSRTIALPLSVQIDKAEAVYEHGVLTLTVPEAEEIKPRTIKVHAVTEGKARAR